MSWWWLALAALAPFAVGVMIPRPRLRRVVMLRVAVELAEWMPAVSLDPDVWMPDDWLDPATTPLALREFERGVRASAMRPYSLQLDATPLLGSA